MSISPEPMLKDLLRMFISCIVNPEAQSSSLIGEPKAEEADDLEVTISLDSERVQYPTP